MSNKKDDVLCEVINVAGNIDRYRVNKYPPEDLMKIFVMVFTSPKKSFFKGSFKGCECSHNDENIKWFCDAWPFSLWHG